MFLLYFSVNYLTRPSWILLVWACLFLEYMHVSSSLFQAVELIQRQVSLKITKNQKPAMSAVHIENGTGKLKTYVDQNQDSKDQIQKPFGLNIDFHTESRAFQQFLRCLFLQRQANELALDEAAIIHLPVPILSTCQQAGLELWPWRGPS